MCSQCEEVFGSIGAFDAHIKRGRKGGNPMVVLTIFGKAMLFLLVAFAFSLLVSLSNRSGR